MRYVYVSLLILMSIFLSVRKSSAQSGVLDSTFSGDGVFRFSQKFADEKAEDVAITSDGKIVTLSHPYQTNQNFIIRFHSNGVVDSSFGTNGILNIIPGYKSIATAITIDTANRIIVLAEVEDYYDPEADVYRYLSDGTPDSTFGNNGKVQAAFDHTSNALVLQLDGKILCAGITHWSYKTIVMRLNDNGTYDSTFNLVGFLVVPNGGMLNAIALDSSGKILVTGSYEHLFVARLLPNGTLDTGFSNDGYLSLTVGTYDSGKDITTTPDGKIIVVGYSFISHSSSANCWRFLDDGTPDPTFGNNGLVKVDSGIYFNYGWFVFSNQDSTLFVGASVYNGRTNDPGVYKLLNNGTKDPGFADGNFSKATFTSTKYIETNAVRTDNGEIIFCSTEIENGNNHEAVSKIFQSGSIDSSFGNNGKATSLGSDSMQFYNDIRDVATLSNGKILCEGNSSALTLLRLSSEGIIDSTFGENGLLVPNGEDYASVSIEADSNHVYCIASSNHWIRDVSESYIFSRNAPYAIIKFFKDGVIDSSYGSNGIAEPIFNDTLNVYAAGAAVHPNGKLLLCAGYDHDVYIFRLDQNGKPDSSFGILGTLNVKPFNFNYDPSIVILPDGRILFGVVGGDSVFNSFYEITRMFIEGNVDSSFGINGTTKIPILFDEANLQIRMTVEQDNKILLKLLHNDNLGWHNYLRRINENGSIDSSFGIDGESHASDGRIFGTAWAVNSSPDNKIVCAGESWGGNPWGEISVLRINYDGTTDSTFGSNGLALCDTSIFGFETNFVQLQPDGKILVGGQKGTHDFFISRLLNELSTNIISLEDLLSLNIFPNPTSNDLQISLPLSSGKNFLVTITNLIGQTVLKQELNFSDDELHLNVNDLSSGIYVLALKCEAGIYSAKFVKE